MVLYGKTGKTGKTAVIPGIFKIKQGGGSGRARHCIMVVLPDPCMCATQAAPLRLIVN